MIKKIISYLNNSKICQEARQYLANEDGGMQQMVWVIGSAVVVALVIVGAMVYAPDTAENFWNASTSWIRNQFGF